MLSGGAKWQARKSTMHFSAGGMAQPTRSGSVSKDWWCHESSGTTRTALDAVPMRRGVVATPRRSQAPRMRRSLLIESLMPAALSAGPSQRSWLPATKKTVWNFEANSVSAASSVGRCSETSPATMSASRWKAVSERPSIHSRLPGASACTSDTAKSRTSDPGCCCGGLFAGESRPAWSMKASEMSHSM